MADSVTVIRGVIHGKTIVLDNELGLPDGQEVTVTVALTAVPSSISASPPSLPTDSQRRWDAASAEARDLPPGEGLRSSFGAWAEDGEELDQYLECNREQ